jgi:hypothetical protein
VKSEKLILKPMLDGGVILKLVKDLMATTGKILRYAQNDRNSIFIVLFQI